MVYLRLEWCYNKKVVTNKMDNISINYEGYVVITIAKKENAFIQKIHENVSHQRLDFSSIFDEIFPEILP